MVDFCDFTWLPFKSLEFSYEWAAVSSFIFTLMHHIGCGRIIYAVCILLLLYVTISCRLNQPQQQKYGYGKWVLGKQWDACSLTA